MRIRFGYADTAEGQMHYRSCGDSALPALVLLHQTASSGAQFERMMALLGKTAHCIALDLPGFGNSFVPESPKPMVWYTDRVIEATTSLGINTVDLFGHHTGACIGVDWASRHEPGVKIRTLILSGPPLLSDTDRARFAARVHALQIRPDGSHLGEVWQTLRERNPDMDLALLNREALLTLQAVNYHDNYTAAFDQPFAEQLARITCDTLIIGGRRDSLRDSVEPTHALLPHAKLAWLDADTYITDTHAQLLAEVVREFLKD